MKVEWTAEASAELDHLLAYVASQDVMAAALVAERVLKAEKGVAEFPRAGRYDAETDTFDRFIPKTRIILTYALRDNAIWIVSVWHTSRDPAARKRET